MQFGQNQNGHQKDFFVDHFPFVIKIITFTALEKNEEGGEKFNYYSVNNWQSGIK